MVYASKHKHRSISMNFSLEEWLHLRVYATTAAYLRKKSFVSSGSAWFVWYKYKFPFITFFNLENLKS